MKIGNGLEADTKMGPLANSRRPDAVDALVQDAKAKGARVLAGGERGEGGFFFQPTLLADVPNEADIMNEEPFGPVAVSRPFDTFEEVIEQANRLPYGLAAFAFTENGRRANLIGDLVESGMVGINTFAISVADAPFGGVKDSGFGSRGRQGRARELPGREGDPPGLSLSRFRHIVRIELHVDDRMFVVKPGVQAAQVHPQPRPPLRRFRRRRGSSCPNSSCSIG